MSGDPVPAIAEAEATGEVAALYADIRATLGVPVVNLTWRHLAIFPGALPWAWGSPKPLYADDSIAAQAAALRAELEMPTLAGLSAPTLASAGLHPDDLSRIAMILHSYERSNAMNMVALCALSARLNGDTPTAGDMAAPLPMEAPISGKMPALLTLDAMAPAVRGLVEDLNRIGGRDEILASMYRHLANWPVYLSLVHTLIAPFSAEGRLEPVIRNVIADGHRRAAWISGGLANPATMPNDGAQADMRTALTQFTDGPIGKMIAIVPLIRQAMPA